jgi:hypothetical protein
MKTNSSDMIRKPKKNRPSFHEKARFLTEAANCTNESKCIEWPWSKHKSPKNYGRWNGMASHTHRLALEVKLGRRLSRAEQAQHTCDNPPCCNGAHLKAGTPLENSRDALNRGRLKIPKPFPSGSEHPDAKLTGEMVRQIRALYKRSKRNGVQLAERFGVDSCTVYAVINRQTWRNLK